MAEIAPGNSVSQAMSKYMSDIVRIYGTGGATASFWNKKLPSRATGHLRLLGSLGNPSKRQRTIGILQKLE